MWQDKDGKVTINFIKVPESGGILEMEILLSNHLYS